MNWINEYFIIIGIVCFVISIPIIFKIKRFVLKMNNPKKIKQKIESGKNSTNIQSGKDIKF